MDELTPRLRGRLWLRLGIRLSLILICTLFLTLAGPGLFSLFAPFVLALLMAWLLNPAVRFFQKKLGGSRRLWSLCLLVGLLALAGGALFALVGNLFLEVRDLAENWQVIWESFLTVTDRVEHWWNRLFPYLPMELTDWVSGSLEQLAVRLQNAGSDLLSALVTRAGTLAMKVPSFAVALVVFLMASYFITADYPHIRYLALSRISPNAAGLLRFVKHTASAAFGGYVRAQLLLSTGVFFILLIGFTFMGQSYALLLALLLAVMDFIPIIGAGTLLVPWALFSLTAEDPRRGAALLVLWGIIALFRRVGEPKVVGNQTGLSPILSLLSIYVGMKLGGVAGMILGPVLFLVAANLFRAGIFDAALADLRLAAGDIGALLKNRA